MDVHRHLAPDRTRHDVEWSVALGYGELSTSRFVIHDVTTEEAVAFLEERGHDPADALRTLRGLGGDPSVLSVGVDGLRTKVDWFLRGEDPHALRLDLHAIGGTEVKRYLRLRPGRAAEAAELVVPGLREPLRWLLSQPPLNAGGLSFVSLLLPAEGAEGCPVVHAHLAPDPHGLLAGDPALLREDLVRRLLERLALGHHLGVVRERVLSPPMTWTTCLSLTLRDPDHPGAIIHARAGYGIGAGA